MSNTQMSVLSIPAVAQAAISYGRAVNVVSSGYPATIAAQATVAGQKVIGIAARAAAAANAEFEIIALGIAQCESGAAITSGTRVACDSVGRVIPAAALAVAAGAVAVTSAAANGATAITGGDPPVFCFGIALEAAAAAGQFIEVLIR
jgi:hypothetical protein